MVVSTNIVLQSRSRYAATAKNRSDRVFPVAGPFHAELSSTRSQSLFLLHEPGTNPILVKDSLLHIGDV